MNIREFIKDNICVFDGATGTYFSKCHPYEKNQVELYSLTHPQWISKIHEDYIKAGSNALRTNTFCCNRTYIKDEETVRQCISSSYDLANQFDCFVFCDIGPISQQYDVYEEYKFVVDEFLNKGATNFIFETNSNYVGLKEIAQYIKTKQPDAYILCSFSIQSDGYTKEGIHIQDCIDALSNSCIDGIGCNCGCGVHHMKEIVNKFDALNLICPNAGYPIIVQNRTVYQQNPVYFADEMMDIVQKGVQFIGGCCGTTPEHIISLCEKLKEEHIVELVSSIKEENNHNTEFCTSTFFKKLQNHEKVIAVELDPPTNWNLSKFMKGAWQLKESVDAITIADCPIGRARMDSSILACKIKRECNIDVLPHMTCRDRNLNATKALLLGNYAEGIRDVLLITGDPIPSNERNEVKTVYQFNSRKLASYISSLEEKGDMSHFNMFGALNVNAINFDIQIELAKEKIKSGMVGLFTQPVLSLQALENLKRAKKELDAYIIGGVIPIVSYRNANFMENEINGIHVEQQIIDLYKDLNRQDAEQLAIRISSQIMKEIEPYVDGFYLMTPFGRTEMMIKIIDLYKEK
ncbi:bifunctional homocysteine S-methyltransferase/methylenetetrahydrofolate reductase [Floccifex sp.]|uniref:bifunctional homocysteine S-methyltransferase/methylenetetrahydrofolate reductase n=1 Tax=Floccifex sp. TaxID=2815810 RepID=UPI002A74D954|nr:bifunctional homocysteine S-methyltransferase/methylenetetrahydrofolate reductase [Floccifex sp.]MDD7281879.1 bifunctional homocysteine S-methyltransferase/methylenetetrahydrofolate reductase [Erysipelotrichaceae bacterium]MDY2958610.1 bifunctional homocysteine S-methyltransferase/methylenetetrahydrofolate reductase [Floccifex sp.]